MKILLFNDNPVVRKLVALSAQKTKDDLNVVWSVDEIEESGYDLLIVDDALYSDETFAALKEAVMFKSTLLMATRGNAVPAGFDHIINKPFLPTDLVDLFAKIDAALASKGGDKVIDLAKEVPMNDDESYEVSDFEHSPTGIELSEGGDFAFDELNDFSDELPSLETEMLPAVLDHEEVEEVRGLLEDTENDELNAEEEIGVDEMDDFDFDELEAAAEPSVIDDSESFDFEEPDVKEEKQEEALSQTEAPLEPLDETFDDEDLLLDDELFLEAEPSTLDDEMLNEDMLNDLELKIQEAVENLEPDDFDRELDTSLLESLEAEDEEFAVQTAAAEEVLEPESLIDALDEMEGFDPFDALDEREIMRAMGEAVDDEPESLTLEEEEGEEEVAVIEESEALPTASTESDSIEGVEALQALLKALANEDVAKSLKGLNISININFGNEK